MSTNSTQAVHVIGGGLAGSEAAWQLARAACGRAARDAAGARDRGAQDRRSRRARLLELVPLRRREHNAVGLLHEEMRRLGSLIMRAADGHKVPAGGALAVDRDGFSAAVKRRSKRAAGEIAREELPACRPPDWDTVIVATGPLTSPALATRSGSSPARTRSPSSTRSRRSSTANPSTSIRPGSSRATTRRARAAPAGTTSTARSRASIRRVHRCAAGRREDRIQGMGEARPISTAACRSR